MSADATVVVTACLLTDGSSVYLRPNETWTRDVQEAAVYSWEDGELHVASRTWDCHPLVFGLGVIEAECRDGSIELYGMSCGG